MPKAGIKVLIGSVGRRVYLVEWFEAGLERLGLKGEIHVTDADVSAAAFARAHHRHLVPPFASLDYDTAMVALISDLRPELFMSINDYEIEVLARRGLAAGFEELGTTVIGVRPERHGDVYDKMRMSRALDAVGIATPPTVLLSDRAMVDEVAASSPNLIIKHRFGSGSSGLTLVSSSEMHLARKWLTRHSERGDPDSFVVQPAINGREYGLDVIAPLKLGFHDVAVLAREKKRMRAGETDQATSVDSAPFTELGARLAEWAGHRGIIDVDVIRTDRGEAYVIDVNPRFGGGYPFSHLAGADVPALFLSQISGLEPRDVRDFFGYQVGVTSSKHEAIACS